MRIFASLLCLSLLACGGDDDAPAQADAGLGPDGGGCESATIFLNREGGTYSPGLDDSSSNTSALLQAETTIAAEAVTAASWDAVQTCLRGHFADFAVTFTDVDPGAAAHREVVISDNTVDDICGGTCGGVSPIECPTGQVDATPRAVMMVRPPSFFTSDQAACDAYAQVIGTSFGLDHVLECQDLLSFDTCADRAFLDQALECGIDTATDCICGGATQNSHQHLLGLLGPACQ